MSAGSSYFINIIPACSPFTCRFPTSIHILGITKIAVFSIWCLFVAMRRNKDFFKILAKYDFNPQPRSPPGPHLHPYFGNNNIAVYSIWCLSVSMGRYQIKYMPNIILIPSPFTPRVPTSLQLQMNMDFGFGQAAHKVWSNSNKDDKHNGWWMSIMDFGFGQAAHKVRSKSNKVFVEHYSKELW